MQVQSACLSFETKSYSVYYCKKTNRYKKNVCFFVSRPHRTKICRKSQKKGGVGKLWPTKGAPGGGAALAPCSVGVGAKSVRSRNKWGVCEILGPFLLAVSVAVCWSVNESRAAAESIDETVQWGAYTLILDISGSTKQDPAIPRKSYYAVRLNLTPQKKNRDPF